MITQLLGGRVAEELVFSEVTTGAQNDLEHVTELARAMVCEYGMSDVLGALTFGRRHGTPFLGRDIMEDRNYSEEVAQSIDREVRDIVEQSHHRATDILTTHREQLDAVVAVLIVEETLSREQLLGILHGAAPADRDPLSTERLGHNVPSGSDTEPEEKLRLGHQTKPNLEPGPA
jgi:cell division protease FtsH